MVSARYWQPSSGWTMLHQAAWWGNQEAANALCKLGADVNRQAGYPTAGLTPCDVQNERGHPVNWAQAGMRELVGSASRQLNINSSGVIKVSRHHDSHFERVG